MEEETKKFTFEELKERSDKLLSIKKNLMNKKDQLEEQLKTVLKKNEDLTKKLTELNYEIEKKNEELQEKIQNDNEEKSGKRDNMINKEEIQKKCIQCFNEFLQDAKARLDFEIRFGRTVIFRTLTDENHTFKNLKEELKSQFDRDINEFFFMNENNVIFLDEMNLKKALFPLNNVSVKNVIPVIIVKDIFKQDDKDDYKNLENIDSESQALNNKQKVFLTLQQKIKRNFQNYKFVYFNVLMTSLLILFWVLSCIEFRSLKTYFMISNTYDFNRFNPGISQRSNLLINIKKKFQQIFQFPNENDKNFFYVKENTNAFNQLRLIMGKMRLIKRDSITDLCTSERLNSELLKKTGCLNRSDFNKIAVRPEIYYKDEFENLIKGKYGQYDNSGIAIDIPLTHPEFYTSINDLINKNWINSNTYLLTYMMNSYSKNADKFIMVRGNFELVGENFFFNLDVKMSDFKSNIDAYLVLAILFSVICFILEFLRLKKSSQKNDAKFEKNIFVRIKKYIEKNFRQPFFLEFVTILNLMYFYFLVILRFSYSAELNEFSKTTDINSFIDTQSYMKKFELINYLNCSNILLFIFTFVNNLKLFSNEFNIIQRNLFKYFFTVYIFDLSFLLGFLIFSSFIAFYLFGHYIISDYNELKFIVLKILTSFFIGSLDIGDSTSNGSFTNGIPSKFDDLTLYADTPYKFLSFENGINGYVIYSVILFIFANFLIRATHSSVFLVVYRDNYNEAIDEIKKEKANFEISEEEFLENESKQKENLLYK